MVLLGQLNLSWFSPFSVLEQRCRDQQRFLSGKGRGVICVESVSKCLPDGSNPLRLSGDRI